jgi:RNA chaperone Hfq
MDVFVSELCNKMTSVTIFLTNGVQIRGVIREVDLFVVVEVNHTPQMLYSMPFPLLFLGMLNELPERTGKQPR